MNNSLIKKRAFCINPTSSSQSESFTNTKIPGRLCTQDVLTTQTQVIQYLTILKLDNTYTESFWRNNSGRSVKILSRIQKIKSLMVPTHKIMDFF